MRLNIQGTGQQVSLFYVNKKGVLNVWPEPFREKFPSMGFRPEIGSAYGRRLRELMQILANRTDFSRALTDADAGKFKLVVDEFIREVQTAQTLS